jgi:hypothetical protein
MKATRRLLVYRRYPGSTVEQAPDFSPTDSSHTEGPLTAVWKNSEPKLFFDVRSKIRLLWLLSALPIFHVWRGVCGAMITAVRQVHDGLPISPADSSGVPMVIAQEPAKPSTTAYPSAWLVNLGHGQYWLGWIAPRCRGPPERK